jgi:hypothetical protein
MGCADNRIYQKGARIPRDALTKDSINSFGGYGELEFGC